MCPLGLVMGRHSSLPAQSSHHSSLSLGQTTKAGLSADGTAVSLGGLEASPCVESEGR